jgi:hypothetical protein
MAKRVIAILALALALAMGLPSPVPVAQNIDFTLRGQFGGFEFQIPRQLRRLFRRALPRLPYDYYEDRGVRSAPRRQLGRVEVVAILHRRGFSDIGIVRQRGMTYICEATGPQGERVRLVVNAMTGGIDGVRVIGVGKPRF